MMDGIRKFYIDTIATTQTNIQPPGIKVSPVTRFEFYVGSALATVFLVQKVAMSAFFLIATVLTCGLSQSTKDFANDNIEDAKVYFGALFVGNVGCFFPGTVNDYFLGIPVEGLVIPAV